MTPEETIAAYNALVLKAIHILDYYQSEHEHTKLMIEGGAAWLSCAKSYQEYDCSYLESETSDSFPVGLLSAAEPEIKAWQKERKRLQEEESRNWQIQRTLKREAEEREQFALLQAKYGK